jgi:hypothetical protein
MKLKVAEGKTDTSFQGSLMSEDTSHQLSMKTMYMVVLEYLHKFFDNPLGDEG